MPARHVMRITVILFAAAVPFPPVAHRTSGFLRIFTLQRGADRRHRGAYAAQGVEAGVPPVGEVFGDVLLRQLLAPVGFGAVHGGLAPGRALQACLLH